MAKNSYFLIRRGCVGSGLWIVASLLSTQSWAAPKSPKNEVYSATEGEQVLTVSTTVSTHKPKAVPPSKPVSKKRPKTAAPKPLFEQVPAEHVESIAGRIKLVEQILRDYGRAYDYRVMTTRQLQAVLDRLDEQSKAEPDAESSSEDSATE